MLLEASCSSGKAVQPAIAIPRMWDIIEHVKAVWDSYWIRAGASEFWPDKTRRVLQPVFWPNNMSVSSLSPTMHILDVSRLKLQQLNSKETFLWYCGIENQQRMQSTVLSSYACAHFLAAFEQENIYRKMYMYKGTLQARYIIFLIHFVSIFMCTCKVSYNE
jgi:hypothetical protein